MARMLPFLILGGAVAAGAFGTKQGVDAVGIYKEATEIASQARERHEAAVARYDAERGAAMESLGLYGRVRLESYDVDLRELADAFTRLGGAGLSDLERVDLELVHALRAF